MFFLIRFLISFGAATLAFLVTFFFAGVILGDRVTGCWVVLTFAVTIGVFAWTSRRLSRGRWARPHVEREIRKLKEQAVERQIAPRAKRTARVLGGGSYATGTLRISSTADTLSIDVAEGGAWRTVFSARFHPEVPGQVVPDRIREHPTLEKQQEVLTKRVGHVPAWWEVFAYIPGDWEEELSRLWKAAEQAEHEQEKDRFGLE
jgi:uncharacterized membrane protein